MSRSTISAHIQILLEVGVIQMRNEYGDELVDPVIRKISGIKRLRSIFVVPVSLVLSEDRLQLLQIPRKDFALVLKRDKNLSDDVTSKRLNTRHNKRNNPKEIFTKESNLDASHLHSHKLVPPYKVERRMSPDRCQSCGKKLTQAVIDYTLQKYGLVLCFDCSRGRSPL